ncbi:uncharacterized protein L201_002723 [Kwoniella dendrophila CBS 6074]|uniref:Uncharacterized protein n=1 Tax=Kwoniella dendrophila CBS 6074 TaxID=1295534 RepID=A0AAX4JRT4_9TREE
MPFCGSTIDTTADTFLAIGDYLQTFLSTPIPHVQQLMNKEPNWQDNIVKTDPTEWKLPSYQWEQALNRYDWMREVMNAELDRLIRQVREGTAKSNEETSPTYTSEQSHASSSYNSDWASDARPIWHQDNTPIGELVKSDNQQPGISTYKPSDDVKYQYSHEELTVQTAPPKSSTQSAVHKVNQHRGDKRADD